MPMENQLAHAITQTEYDSSYDKAAKKLLANKQILAQIMKNCVNEYSACSVDEIAEKYIEGTPEVGTVGVHVDDTNRPQKTSDVIVGSNNEDSTLTEGTVNYDVRFDAIAPALEGSTARKDVIRLIINVEAQTAFNPGYPLTKRAIYYCSRMISAQHGPIFTNSEYGKIRKVYSIWVCTHPTKEFQNTLIRYSIRPEQLIGNAVEKSENYDLMSVVTICLGEPGTENYTGIVKFMDVLLSSSRAATEKKKILEEEFGVAMNEELEREVLVMCNLSQGVKAEGINIGEMRMLVKQVRKGRVTIEEAAEDAGMTVEESAWFYGYYNHKSNDNLPTLAAIAEMSEADVNSLLPGYHIDQLREVWGKPDTSENGTACWKIGNDTILVVSYKNNGIVAICGLKDDSGASIGE